MKYIKRLLVILLVILFFCFMITTILFFLTGAILVSVVRYVIKGDFEDFCADAIDDVEDSYMFVLDKICSIGD